MFIIKNHRKHKLSLYTIYLIIVVYSLHIFVVQRYKQPQKVIMWDVISYYAYLPACFIDNDIGLSFWKNEKPYNERYWPKDTENGKFVIKTTMGVSFFYAPFFFVAHLCADSFGFQPNGFTTPYALALQLSALFYVIWALFILRKLLLKYFDDKSISITLIIIALFTNLYWYTTSRDNPMSHSYDFFLFSAFLYLSELWHERTNFKNSILIGIVSGLIALIRPTNIIIALIFIFYNVKSIKDVSEKINMLIRNYKYLIVIVLISIAIWIPQFIYWKTITGSFLYYSYGNDERFFFNQPLILQVLFSFRKGWLIYTPVMIFSLVGIILLHRNLKEYSWGISIFFVLNLYVISSWWCWWYGGSFGMRPLIESYAILAIPLSVAIQWIFKQKKTIKLSLLTVLIVLSLQSGFHTLQYYFETIHYEAMTSKAYFDSFWRLKRSNNHYNLIETPDYEKAKKGDRLAIDK